MLYLVTKWWRHQVNAILDIFGRKCRHGSCHVAYMFYNTHPLLPHTHSCHRRSSQTNMYPMGSSPPLSSESCLKYKAEINIRFLLYITCPWFEQFVFALWTMVIFKDTKLFLPWSFSRKRMSVFGIYFFMLRITHLWCFILPHPHLLLLLRLLLIIIISYKVCTLYTTPIWPTVIIQHRETC